MSNESKENKIELSKKVIQQLFTQSLRDDDKFGLIKFDTEGKLVYPLKLKTEVNSKALFEEITQIQAGGGTVI